MQPTAFDKAKELFAIERVVAFIVTPGLLIVSPWFVKLMATWYPGVHLTPGEVSHVIVVVLAGIILTSIMWLHGRQIPALVHTEQSVLAAVKANPSLVQGLLGQLLPQLDHNAQAGALLAGVTNVTNVMGAVGSDLAPAVGLGTQVAPAAPPETDLPPAGDGPPLGPTEVGSPVDGAAPDMWVPPAGDFAEPAASAAVTGSPGLTPASPPA